MRHSATIKTRFWMAGTGRCVLKKHGVKTAWMMINLMSSPLSSQDGIFWYPISTLAEQTGLSENEAIECLHNLIDAGFCKYDFDTNLVWLIKAGKHNLGNLQNAANNRVKGAFAHIDALPDSPLIAEFRQFYGLDEAVDETISESLRNDSEVNSKSIRNDIEMTPMPKPIAHLNHPDADSEKNPDLGVKKSGGEV